MISQHPNTYPLSALHRVLCFFAVERLLQKECLKPNVEKIQQNTSQGFQKMLELWHHFDYSYFNASKRG
jgi:hypothetical protein